ncbi:YwqJ-related putative deaminase [Streptomyces sp. I05A-00742]|uniref:YwqJ-related putative deaminase n=1 Tax=Streptomyces sp. I05A-00742 TaxID=2732853 RepID=UPI0014882B0D|nr:YwqJ-related putative deaminase [Streptomyces sp. I05A-00742]
MSEVVPGVASSLLIQGKIFSITSLAGEGEPRLHPAVGAFFRALPVEQRESFLGRCAESALVSDQLWGLDDVRTDGRSSTLDDSVPHFEGSLIVSVLVREQGDPEHGRGTLPCRSCTALLNRLGVEIRQP